MRNLPIPGSVSIMSFSRLVIDSKTPSLFPSMELIMTPSINKKNEIKFKLNQEKKNREKQIYICVVAYVCYTIITSYAYINTEQKEQKD